MEKNSPQHIALKISIYIGIIAISLSAINILFSGDWSLIIFTFLSGVIISVSTYYIVTQLLKKYIQQKVKLIYKTIQGSSKKIEYENIEIGKDVLGAVSSNVQKQIRKKQKEVTELKRLEAYRKEFFGNVSHELKTPIFNIQGYIHTLIDGALNDPNVNKTYLLKAAKSVDRLNAIVNDLEAITQLEAGLSLEKEYFDIKSLTEDIFESLEIKAETKDIKLSLKKTGTSPVMVYADKERIRQVLVNLLDNSIKYGKEDGTTTVQFYDSEDSILVEVSDDGPGIAKEHLQRLFERFYRVDKSRSREQGGTGLGLSIVKHIIDAHQQNISVSSKVGEGTTFTFTLSKSR